MVKALAIYFYVRLLLKCLYKCPLICPVVNLIVGIDRCLPGA